MYFQIEIVERLTCHICQKVLAGQGKLQRHLKIHAGDRPFECEMCDRRFGRREHLNRHVRTHTGERPFECYVCKATFTRPTFLNVHLKSHSEESLLGSSVAMDSSVAVTRTAAEAYAESGAPETADSSEDEPMEENLSLADGTIKTEQGTHSPTNEPEDDQCRTCHNAHGLQTHELGLESIDCKVCGSSAANLNHTERVRHDKSKSH